MQIIADLHIHSRFSRAVSQRMDLQENARWASKKGISLLSTADWTHPIWFKEITTNLKEVNDGVFELKERPDGQKNDVYFVLSTEISTIYSQGDRLRRVHNLLFAPSLSAVEKLNKKLTTFGAKLMSDGRPIIGMSSKALLDMALSVDENFLFIPAHAWTPWYGIFGSQSGFDSLNECFEDMSKYIYAVETGLSSDPLMNWQIKELESRSIVSFSDAHSSQKLGREATIFSTNKESMKLSEISFKDVLEAIQMKANSKLKIVCTIEFFPEHGKYHWTGHRNCGVKFSLSETKKRGYVCPICLKPLVVGVEKRVGDLSEKELKNDDLVYKKNSVGTTFVYEKNKSRAPFVSAVPLIEILEEVEPSSPRKLWERYEQLISVLGTEFDILLKKPVEEIKSLGSEKLGQAIKIMRGRKVHVDPGFDGVFGKVKIFKDDEKKQETTQKSLF